MPDPDIFDAWEQISVLRATLPPHAKPTVTCGGGLPTTPTYIPYPFEPGPTPFPEPCPLIPADVPYPGGLPTPTQYIPTVTITDFKPALLGTPKISEDLGTPKISDEDVKRIASAVVESIINDDRVGFAISQAIREERKLRKIARRARRKDRERRKSR